MKNVRTRHSIPHAEYFPQAGPVNGPSRWLSTVRLDVEELARFRSVLRNMVTQELRVRYHRSVLGFFWTLINPILMMATLTMVFSQLLVRDGNWQSYAVYLFAGMLPWSLFAGSLTECSACILANEGLIRKIYLPKLIFPLAKVATNLTTFVLSLVSLSVLAVLLGTRFSPSMVLLPVVIALFATFALGLGLILAVANTYFRDTAHLVGVVLQAWYFATPIMYGQDGLSRAMQARCWLNPAFPFVRMFQLIIHGGRWPDPTLFLAATGIAAASLAIGYVTFKTYEDKLVFRL